MNLGSQTPNLTLVVCVCVCVLKNMFNYYPAAWGGGYAGLRVRVVCEEMVIIGKLEGKGVHLEASTKGSSDILLATAKG